MQPSVLEKLNALLERHQEIEQLLSAPEIIADNNRFTELSKEYAQLSPLIDCYKLYQTAAENLGSAEALCDDPELGALAEEDIAREKKQLLKLADQIKRLLIPQEKDDLRNVYLEIRAGTGGDEAAIFAGDLFRMYHRYVEKQGWQLEIISSSEGEHGGFKEIITKISGKQVYARLKFESGAHRVQRVPETESQGRIHTSACTVAILPEVESIDEIKLEPDALRIDTFRASGAGGQHVNVTDSAIRITHLPTGLVVECQDERSQHKNKAKAMALLQARLLAAEQAKQRQAEADTRKRLVGSGDRSERIRTYNYPQARVTDHRINLTLYKLDEVLAGDLDQIIQPLVDAYQMDQLIAMGLAET